MHELIFFQIIVRKSLMCVRNEIEKMCALSLPVFVGANVLIFFNTRMLNAGESRFAADKSESLGANSRETTLPINLRH